MCYRIVSGVAGLIEQNTPFYAVKTLITRLLELDKCHNAHERENLILSHVSKDPNLSNMLPLLNDLLMVKVNAYIRHMYLMVFAYFNCDYISHTVSSDKLYNVHDNR